jgi:hypothetical protein
MEKKKKKKKKNQTRWTRLLVPRGHLGGVKWYRFAGGGGGGLGGEQAPSGRGSSGGRFDGRGLVRAGQHSMGQTLRHADGGHLGLEHREQQRDEPQQHQLCTQPMSSSSIHASVEQLAIGYYK